jgi:hypothetical protein
MNFGDLNSINSAQIKNISIATDLNCIIGHILAGSFSQNTFDKCQKSQYFGPFKLCQ